MKLELAKLEDSEQMGAWAVRKLEDGYDLSVDELQGTILKVANAFFIPARQVMFLGPLIPSPEVDGKTLTVALHRMIKTIRKTFSGDIVYLNYQDNGIDQAAVEIGGFAPCEDVVVMTRHGSAKLMVLRGESIPSHVQIGESDGLSTKNPAQVRWHVSKAKRHC